MLCSRQSEKENADEPDIIHRRGTKRFHARGDVKVEHVIKGIQDIDQERLNMLDQIKASIVKGEYEIDEKKIACKIVRSIAESGVLDE